MGIKFIVGSLKVFWYHPNFTYNWHEVCITTPTWNYMKMKMFIYSCPSILTEIHTYIKATRAHLFYHLYYILYKIYIEWVFARYYWHYQVYNRPAMGPRAASSCTIDSPFLLIPYQP